MLPLDRFHLLGIVRLTVLLAVSAGLLQAQARFPMRHVDEIGHFGNGIARDGRMSADLGPAQVFLEPKDVLSEDVLRFEGKDRAGKAWRLWMEQFGGVGTTEVWTADFDHNGQLDLLIASYGGRNGRCVDGTIVTVLLFDNNGRPVPWRIQTYIPQSKGDPFPPVLLLDQNRDHRAEFVITACEYSDPGKHNHFGEDRWIAGVYEARDARMIPIRNAPMAPYTREAKRAHPSPADDPGYITWLPVKPKDWPDQMSGFESPARLKLLSLMPQFSDGRTRQFALYGDKEFGGRPWVVMDSLSGRDIYLTRVEEQRRRIMNEGYALKLLGDDREPSWIWVDATGR